MGFITELISGDKKRAHEEEMRRIQAEENAKFLEQLQEQNRLAAESNQKMFDMINRGNSGWDSFLNGEGAGNGGQNGGQNGNGSFDYSKYMPGNGQGGGNDMMITPDNPASRAGGNGGAGAGGNAGVGGHGGIDYSAAFGGVDTSNNHQTRVQERTQGNLDRAVANPHYNPFTSKVEGSGPMTDGQLALSEDRNRAYADMYGLDYKATVDRVRQPAETDTRTDLGGAGADQKTTKADAGGFTDLDGADAPWAKKDDAASGKDGFKDLDSADAPWAKKDATKDEFVDLDKKAEPTKDDKIDQAGRDFDNTAKTEPEKCETKPKDDPAKSEKIDALKDRVADVKGEIDERVKKGELTKEEGEAMKAKLDEKVKAAENGEGTEAADKALKEVNTLDNNLNKIGDLKGRADDLKGEIDERVKNGELTKEEGDAAKGKIDEKMNAVKNGEADADKVTEDVNRADNNLNKLGDLKGRVDDVKGELDARVKSGELTQEEADKCKAKIDEKVAAVKNGEADADEVTGEINKLDNNLNKLGDLKGRANDVTAEIDQRVKDGELSQEAGDKAKADITENMGKTRETLLDLDSKNTGSAKEGEKPKTDEEVLANTTSNINDMDNYLNKLAGLDDKADAAKTRLDQQVADGKITQDDATQQTKEIDAKQKATELHTLAWV